MGSPPSANRGSPSTWPIVTSRPRSANLSSRTRLAMSNTPVTWSPGRRPRDLAVILVDARKGVLTQTRRHSYLTQLLGIKSMVLAVNKMDLVNYAQATFDSIVADYRVFADSIGISRFCCHSDIKSCRGQHYRRLGQHALVCRPCAHLAPRDRCDRRYRRTAAAVSHAGAMGQSPESGFPRLRRTDFARKRPTG